MSIMLNSDCVSAGAKTYDGAGIGKSSRQGEISRELEELGGAIMQIYADSEKLYPLINNRPTAETNQKEQVEEGLCDMADKLRGMTETVRIVRQRILAVEI